MSPSVLPAPGWRPDSVRVRVPASSANLGSGFDALGLCLGIYDDVVVRAAPAAGAARSTMVTVAGEGAGTVPADEHNLVVRALLAGVAHIARCGSVGDALPDLVLDCTNRIPHGRGLGSSAAAVVAGLLAARGLLADGPRVLDDAAVLALATDLEGHPDNVAAALLGGLTIAWTCAGAPPGAVRLDPDPGVRPVVLVPAGELSTRAARGLLPAVVPHADAAHAAGRSALLVAALTGRPDHLLAATEDRLHQGYRAAAMPDSARLLAALRAGGLPAVVSGAGPAVLVLTRAGQEPAVEALAERDAAPWTVLTLAVDAAGARVESVGVHPSGPDAADREEHAAVGRAG